MLTLTDVALLEAVARVELAGVFCTLDLHYTETDCGGSAIRDFFMVATTKPVPVESDDDIRAYSLDRPDDYDDACDILEREIAWILEDELGDMRLYPAENET